MAPRDSLDVVVDTLHLDYWWRIYRSPIDYIRWHDSGCSVSYGSLVSFSSLNEHSLARSGC